MTAATTGDWVYWLLAALLGFIGVVILYFALLHDRSRGRKRCSRCWYDMSGAPGLTCSECGKTVKRERKLFKTRRRWRLAMVGLLLLAGAGGCYFNVRVKRDGWMSLTPNSVLVLSVPRAAEPKELTEWRMACLQELMRNRLAHGASEPMPDMWDWQWRSLLDRGIEFVCDPRAYDKLSPFPEYDRLLLDAIQHGVAFRVGLHNAIGAIHAQRSQLSIDSPGYCCAGTPYIISYERQSSLQGYFDPDFEFYLDDDPDPLHWRFVERLTSVACSTGEPTHWIAVTLPETISPGSHNLRIAVHEQVIEQPNRGNDAPQRDSGAYSTQLSRRVEVSDSYREVVAVDRSPELDATFRENLQITSVNHYGGVSFCVDLNRMRERLPEGIGRIEFLRNRQVICFRSWRLSDIARNGVRLIGMPSMEEMERIGDNSKWRVRFRMDPEAMASWGIGDSYWPGVIEQPLVWSRRHAAFLPADASELKMVEQ